MEHSDRAVLENTVNSADSVMVETANSLQQTHMVNENKTQEKPSSILYKILKVLLIILSIPFIVIGAIILLIFAVIFFLILMKVILGLIVIILNPISLAIIAVAVLIWYMFFYEPTTVQAQNPQIEAV